jgi:hypothetical protein
MTRCPVCKQGIPRSLVLSFAWRYSGGHLIDCPHCSATLGMSSLSLVLQGFIAVMAIGLALFLFGVSTLFGFLDLVVGLSVGGPRASVRSGSSQAVKIRCRNCGALNGEDELFCGKCGQKL